MVSGGGERHGLPGSDCRPVWRQNRKGRSSGGIQSGLMASSMARALPGMRRMNPLCSSRISMEFTDGGVRSKNRWKSAWLGATPAWLRIMYSRMKARNCPCWRVGAPRGGGGGGALLGGGGSRRPRGGGGGSEPTQRRINGLGSGFHNCLDLHRGFHPEDLLLENGAQLLGSVAQQRPRFGDCLAELANIGFSLRVHVKGGLHGHGRCRPRASLFCGLKIARPVKRRRLSNCSITGKRRNSLRGSSQTRWL